MLPDFEKLLAALRAERVAFVIVGGVALVLRGAGRVTRDLDLCYDREPHNLEGLARSLAPHHPRLRGAPAELPFLWDARTLASGLNFTLTTDLGDLDLLGEVLGVGGYREVLAASSSLELLGHGVPVLDLDGLERSKRAAGRAKDLVDLAEIAEIRRQRARGV